ncbi:hypothetical protein CLAVI_000409 [Candidatus Clavichlamydia salmonicola]|uniref:hypothetical protein n=1 Tax=Candidatus Clavichlamydia salmonicola TaxID=469812 RepID=UPI001891C4D6|nr:hypothetical protein [Candidatus Clavichlamydia salmonicola]MBF5050790.1 hypothetical protein [Candidatus Clavichlamydia salmonicola]
MSTPSNGAARLANWFVQNSPPSSPFLGDTSNKSNEVLDARVSAFAVPFFQNNSMGASSSPIPITQASGQGNIGASSNGAARLANWFVQNSPPSSPIPITQASGQGNIGASSNGGDRLANWFMQDSPPSSPIPITQSGGKESRRLKRSFSFLGPKGNKIKKLKKGDDCQATDPPLKRMPSYEEIKGDPSSSCPSIYVCGFPFTGEAPLDKSLSETHNSEEMDLAEEMLFKLSLEDGADSSEEIYTPMVDVNSGDRKRCSSSSSDLNLRKSYPLLFQSVAHRERYLQEKESVQKEWEERQQQEAVSLPPEDMSATELTPSFSTTSSSFGGSLFEGRGPRIRHVTFSSDDGSVDSSGRQSGKSSSPSLFGFLRNSFRAISVRSRANSNEVDSGIPSSGDA